MNLPTTIEPSHGTPMVWTDAQVDLIKRTIAPDATNDELQLFLYTAKKRGLDPLAGQLHFTKRGGKVTMITSVDSMRLIAARSKQYAGSDEPEFEEENGQPTKASVTVYRNIEGTRVPFVGVARWSEFFPGDKQGFMWRKMPYHMLGKTAEVQALRKAFPEDLSGLYATEEMDRSKADEHQRIENKQTYIESLDPKPTRLNILRDEFKKTVHELPKEMKSWTRILEVIGCPDDWTPDNADEDTLANAIKVLRETK